MQYIKAPFNFVPLSKKVYFPDWGKQISHDVPFSDGISGQLILNLKAETPIFIRDGENDTEFCNFNGEYFIPSTSIKGMVRNVLEIMSFGKLNIDEKMRFATREWDDKHIYNLKDPREQSRVQCGWLKRVDGEIKIYNCGKPKRINHKRIDSYLESINVRLGENNLGIPSLEDTFKRGSSVDLNEDQIIGSKRYDPKTACFKYVLLESEIHNLKNKSFSDDEENKVPHQDNRVMFSDEGDLKGTVVFTGQPDNWTFPRGLKGGKFYEFVFPDKNLGEFTINPIEFEKFEYLHRGSDDWNFWKGKLNTDEGIPVFFRNNGDNIKDFGLAFLYKIPFKYGVKELIDIHQNFPDYLEPDLAQCIFGYTYNIEENKRALKGRVQFGHAKAVNTPQPFENIIKTTLGSPKPSYFPLYVKQTNISGDEVIKYITYNDENASISGWKRYPIRNSAQNQPTENPELDTEFRPLKSGVKFQSKINFHNLKPVELGALLSAISFHGNNDQLFHSLGMAKSQGFGKIGVSYTIESEDLEEPKNYMAEFEKSMSNFLKEKWHKTSQLKELCTMAWDKESMLANVDLRYMQMSTERDNNEFLKAKELKEYLKQYTDLSSDSFELESISEPFEQKEKEERIAREAENIERLRALLMDAELLEKADNFELALKKCDEAKLIFPNEIKELEIRNRLVRKIDFKLFKSEGDWFFNEKNYKLAKEKYLEAQKSINNQDVLRTEIYKCNELLTKQLGLGQALNLLGDFDTNIKRINSYIKKSNITLLSEEDQSTLFELLPNWITMKQGKKKEWNEDFDDSNKWKLIQSWVGQEVASKWYDKLIKGNK